MSSLIPYRFKAPRARDLFSADFFRPFFSDLYRESFRVDVSDRGDSYLLEAELPGLTRESIRLDVEDGVLTISTDTSSNQRREEEDYVYSERRSHSASRSFSLNQIDEEGISARYEDGVLKVDLPKSRQESRGKSIPVE